MRWPWQRSGEPSEARKTITIDELVTLMTSNADADVVEAAKNSYTTSSTTYGTIRRIATSAQSVPWIVQRETKNGDHVDLPSGHDVVKILRQPNPWHTWDYIVEHMLGSLMLTGNAYAFLNGPNDAVKPREIVPLVPSMVRVERAPNLDILRYVVTTPAGERFVPPERMWHAFLWNPQDVLTGFAPVRAAASDIATGVRMRKWNLNLVKNMARPPGSLSTAQALTDQQWARLNEFVAKKYAGPANAGKVPVLEAGLKWEREGLTPAEMDWSRGLRETRRDIVTALGVAPELMGDPETKTYANALHARLALYEDAVVPLLKVVAHSLTIKLRRYWPDVVFTLDIDSTPAMQERRREYAQTLEHLVALGIITRNEARQELGWEPIEGADALLVPLGLSPIDDVDAGETDETQPDPEDEDEGGEGGEEEMGARRRQNGHLVSVRRRG